jgi:isoquinoline 1-oxidoreductase alpha subunit
MQAAALLEKNPNPSREEIKSHMNGVLCRCGTYLRILEAIEMAKEQTTTTS